MILKNKGYNFNHIAELHFITIANKLDMSYDLYIKHKMHAVEWKLNAMITKNKSLINKFDPNWRHPLNRKFESYRVWMVVINEYVLYFIIFIVYKRRQ